MSQTILKCSAFTEATLYMPCPKCEHECHVKLPAFVMAINEFELIECVACNNKFMVMLLRLTRQPEQSNDAETGIPEALCDDVEHDFLKNMGDKFCGQCGTPL